MSIIDHCLCGAPVCYQLCCGRFIDNQENPNTAEELMRSRYSAYVQNKITYIKQTMTGPAATNLSLYATEDLATISAWLGLQIIRSFQKSNLEQAFVEFIVTYEKTGAIKQLHEIAEFWLINNCWYYYNAEIIMPSVNKESVT